MHLRVYLFSRNNLWPQTSPWLSLVLRRWPRFPKKQGYQSPSSSSIMSTFRWSKNPPFRNQKKGVRRLSRIIIYPQFTPHNSRETSLRAYTIVPQMLSFKRPFKGMIRKVVKTYSKQRLNYSSHLPKRLTPTWTSKLINPTVWWWKMVLIWS